MRTVRELFLVSRIGDDLLRMWIQKRLRVYIQNVPVCTGTTRTCSNTRARGAGIHEDVLNGHTEACRNPHTVFPSFFSVAEHAHTHTPNTHHDHQQHHDHDHNHDFNIKHTTSHGERETEMRQRKREDKFERSHDKTKEDETRQEGKRR